MFSIYGSLPGSRGSPCSTSPTAGRVIPGPAAAGAAERQDPMGSPRGLAPRQFYMVLFADAPGDSTPNSNPCFPGSHICESYSLAGQKRN